MQDKRRFMEVAMLRHSCAKEAKN